MFIVFFYLTVGFKLKGVSTIVVWVFNKSFSISILWCFCLNPIFEKKSRLISFTLLGICKLLWIFLQKSVFLFVNSEKKLLKTEQLIYARLVFKRAKGSIFIGNFFVNDV